VERGSGPEMEPSDGGSWHALPLWRGPSRLHKGKHACVVKLRGTL